MSKHTRKNNAVHAPVRPLLVFFKISVWARRLRVWLLRQVKDALTANGVILAEPLSPVKTVVPKKPNILDTIKLRLTLHFVTICK